MEDIDAVKAVEHDGSLDDDVGSSTFSTMTLTNSTSKSSSRLSSLPDKNKSIWKINMRTLARRAEDFWGGNSYLETNEDEYGEDKENESLLHNLKCVLRGVFLEVRHYIMMLFSRPSILFSVLFTFALLCSSGLILLEYLCESNKDKLMHTASLEALETGNFFRELFAKVLLPLYSIQQAVIHSSYFKDLPDQIGSYGEVGSAPITHDPFNPESLNYRDVRGICDDKVLQDEFHRIVESTNKNSEMDGIIVNYRLAPHCVYCLSDPIVNYKDFEEGYFNTSRNIGKDLMNTPGTFWHNTLYNVFESPDDIDVFGPINVTQGGVNIMPELYCAHLAVDLPGYNLTFNDGRIYHSWGFVMSFIHWSKLKEKSGIYARFQDRGLEFHLTRTDIVNDPETGDSYEKVVTIAKSEKSDSLSDMNSIIVNITTPNGLWENRVGYEKGYMFPGHSLLKVFIILTSFAISAMLTMILIERMQHKNLLYKIMPQRAIQKLQRGQTVVEHYNIVTIFFSDIVSFTSIAGEMSPLSVMKMLNDLYCEFDRLVEKHGVYKVETIGDAYMVVGGAPYDCSAPEAAENVASFGLDAIDLVKNFRAPNGDRINIRAGIASGPVVAGVVGKAMPRYCFFGDTVNCASRMESTSKTMKIQCSDLTYRLLNDAPNYRFYLEERQEDGKKGIDLKGKGHQHSWWVLDKNKIEEGTRTHAYDIEYGSSPWSIEEEGIDTVEVSVQFAALSDQAWSQLGQNETPMVAATANHIIMINRCSAILQVRLEDVLRSRNIKSSLSLQAKKEIRAYVSHIESLYNEVEYHTFEHACHVTISMNKLLSSLSQANENQKGPLGCKLKHPLIHFSLIFAALIHDVGHTGQSNQILLDQEHSITKCYSESYAERLSIDLSLQILFRDEFSAFRTALIPDISSKILFGKMLFSSVLITDIANTENVQMGTNRCKLICEIIDKYKDNDEKADSEVNYDPLMCPLIHTLKDVYSLLSLTEDEIEDNESEFRITKAGLEMCVISEHVMQICDVAHLMQGWENFLKWNYRLYMELMVCHSKELMPDPSGNWYSGQIIFIEKYIIPLAERTEQNLGYFLNLSSLAEKNKARWENEGNTITKLFVDGVKNKESEEEVLKKCLSEKR